jgi:gliding motility-associated-like protein
LAFDSLQIATQLQQPGCLFNTGTIRLRVSGGIPPYSYRWLPNVSSTDSAINLTNGNYRVMVTDARLCSRELDFNITTLVPATVSIQKIADADCNGSLLGSAKTILTGGTAPFAYQWQTQPMQNTDTACCLSPGRTSLQVTDSNGCRSLTDVVIGLQGICNDVFFSNSFSPNGDGRNEGFGPLGNVLGISRYQLHIYNRYGQPVFASSNPLFKWDGYFKGKLSATGVYVWRCSYWYNNQVQRNQKGTVLLMR